MTDEWIEQQINEAQRLVDEAAKTITGFEFRHDQRDYCVATVAQYLIDPDTVVIINAPTGSGKSFMGFIIAQAINISDVCEKQFYKNDEEGYVDETGVFMLTAERSLQMQFDNDLQNMEKSFSHGCLYGMDNYSCDQNGKKFSEGVCRASRMKTAEIQKLPCFATCQYFQMREQARNADVTLLNFHNWLIHMNKVNGGMDVKRSFSRRKATIIDEGHLIPKVIEDMYSLRYNTQGIQTYFDSLGYMDLRHKEVLQRHNLKPIIGKELHQLHMRMKKVISTMQPKIDKNIVFEQLEEVVNIINILINDYTDISTFISDAFCDGDEIDVRKLPEDWKKIYHAYNSLSEIKYNTMEYIENLYEDNMVQEIDGEISMGRGLNVENLVVDVQEQHDSMTNTTNYFTQLRSINIEKLYKKYVLNNTRFAVIMSASFGGGITQYAQSYGIEDFKAMNVPSRFNFPNSDIVKVCQHNLGARHKERNIIPAVQLVDALISHPKHANQRGIIHTGNYEFMESILRFSSYPNRFLSYTNTEEKMKVIEQHKTMPNSILIGPSLTTGVSLDDELARFMIMFKVPYPNLGDNLNFERMKNIEGWYEFETLLSITQMLGRPIRHAEDWCTTYLIDKNFEKFFAGEKMTEFFPDYVTKRIR